MVVVRLDKTEDEVECPRGSEDVAAEVRDEPILVLERPRLELDDNGWWYVELRCRLLLLPISGKVSYRREEMELVVVVVGFRDDDGTYLLDEPVDRPLSISIIR